MQVTIITDPAQVDEWLQKARDAYDDRNERLADLTDEAVDEFYTCTLCQSFAPNHVCLVSPERLGLCGAYNWLDCKASLSDQPDRPQPADPQGRAHRPGQGLLRAAPTSSSTRQSHGTVQEVADVLHHGSTR